MLLEATSETEPEVVLASLSLFAQPLPESGRASNLGSTIPWHMPPSFSVQLHREMLRKAPEESTRLHDNPHELAGPSEPWQKSTATSLPAVPFCHLTFLTGKPCQPAYPLEPLTLGEHLRRNRAHRGLLQRETAAEIGVSSATYLRWETGRSAPALRHEPRVIAFLGEDPRPTPTTVAGQLQLLRRRRGLSLRAFAEQLGVDWTTLRAWESGRRKPNRAHARLIARILTGIDPHH
jgi:DNA-binding transcriptional regulator YiaG